MIERQAEANRQFLVSRLGDGFEDIETDQYEDQIATGTNTHCHAPTVKQCAVLMAVCRFDAARGH